jgi:hypothetical protein
MPQLKQVSYDTPFENVDLAESSKFMRELLGKKSQPPLHIYLLHTMMPEWQVCVRFRLIRRDGTDQCGYISIRDAEIIKGRWQQRVTWLSKWTPSTQVVPMTD